MATAIDVAKFIFDEHGSMTTMKLQKLAYYSQAWSLVWDDAPLFTDRIEAWANGPVIKSLYDLHKGKYSIDSWPHGDVSSLTSANKETITAVLDAYADYSALELSNLSHSEKPWIDARKNLDPSERGNSEITLESMADYFTYVYQSSQENQNSEEK